MAKKGSVMDTAIAVNTSARDLTGKLAVSLIRESLQQMPAPAPAPQATSAATGKGTTIDVRV